MISGVSQPNPNLTRPTAAPASNPLGVQWVGSSAAPAATVASAQQVPQQAVAQNQVAPMGEMLSQLFSGLMTALKGLVGWIANLFKQSDTSTQPPVVQPPVVQPPVPPTGGVDYMAIAQQYNLLATPENVQAFLNEVKTYETDGALGPGSNNPQAVKDLQTVLAKFGFTAPATGVYDNVTAQAVIQFKTQHGIRQTYKAANGTPAVNEYADKQTLELIMRKLEALMTQPPVIPPVIQPQPPVQSVPTPAGASNPLGMQWQGGAPAQAPVTQAPAAPASQTQAPNPLGVQWAS